MKNRGKKIPVIAKTDLFGIVKKGEELFVQAVLYEKETVLHYGMASYFHKDTPNRTNFGRLPSILWDKPLGTTREIGNNNEGQMIMVSMLPTIAPVGSYKSLLIVTADGTEYPSSNLLGRKSIGDVFDKI